MISADPDDGQTNLAKWRTPQCKVGAESPTRPAARGMLPDRSGYRAARSPHEDGDLPISNASVPPRVSCETGTALCAHGAPFSIARCTNSPPLDASFAVMRTTSRPTESLTGLASPSTTGIAVGIVRSAPLVAPDQDHAEDGRRAAEMHL